MTSRDFVYWLQGFFEISKADVVEGDQVEMPVVAAIFAGIAVLGLLFVWWHWMVDRFEIEVSDYLRPTAHAYPCVTTVTAEVSELVLPGVRRSRTRQFEIEEGEVFEGGKRTIFFLNLGVLDAYRRARKSRRGSE